MIIRFRLDYMRYSDCPEATEYSRSRALGGWILRMISGVVGFGALICFITETIDLFSKPNWIDYLLSWGILLVVAAFDLYLLFFREMITNRECNVILAKKRLSSSPNVLSETIKKLQSDSKLKMKSIAKYYSIYFLCGALCVTGLVGLVSGICFMCHGQNGIFLLIESLIGIIIVILLTVFFIKKLRGANGVQNTKVMPTNERTEANSINRNDR